MPNRAPDPGAALTIIVLAYLGHLTAAIVCRSFCLQFFRLKFLSYERVFREERRSVLSLLISADASSLVSLRSVLCFC